MKEREPQNSLNILLLLASIGVVSTFAFSRKSKEEVWKRAEGKSEISGVKYTQMEVMHTDHTRDDSYDSPEKGLLVGILEHLLYHIVHRGRAGNIGLTEDQNESAINLIHGRMRDE